MDSMSPSDEPVQMFSCSFSSGPEKAPVPLGNKPTLQMIQALEREMLKMPQVEIEPVHRFAEGLYCREITIPAGTCLTGKLHRTGHFNFLLKGEITVWTEQGMKRLSAPQVIVSEPGTKRVGYAHTDTVWVTVHATEETDVQRIEAALIEPETPAIEHEDIPCLSLQRA